jgi:hypothetical protein
MLSELSADKQAGSEVMTSAAAVVPKPDTPGHQPEDVRTPPRPPPPAPRPVSAYQVRR